MVLSRLVVALCWYLTFSILTCGARRRVPLVGERARVKLVVLGAGVVCILVGVGFVTGNLD